MAARGTAEDIATRHWRRWRCLPAQQFSRLSASRRKEPAPRQWHQAEDWAHQGARTLAERRRAERRARVERGVCCCCVSNLQVCRPLPLLLRESDRPPAHVHTVPGRLKVVLWRPAGQRPRQTRYTCIYERVKLAERERAATSGAPRIGLIPGSYTVLTSHYFITFSVAF